MFKVGDLVQHNENKTLRGTVSTVVLCHECGKESIILKEGFNLEYHADNFTQVQRVWKTWFELPYNCGYFVWEIIEVIGEPHDASYDGFKETRDGTHVLVGYNHTFRRETVNSWMKDRFESQELIVIETKETFQRWDDLTGVEKDLYGN